ncbi:ParB/RepB/Spo0J family partition protein [Deinococcus knuensis]|uniref:Chromosome partitioning protein ParB n=1 Tax=Deinococcus knuensis TaxID=1837380 RepID=A0ABQ2SEG4_9DEIO|nr:ParB/RepB/Spo0J family partition protein [Deinococcus knuensis]GGS25514.1 chromosome partitioning protein ParB [Deinococcus knuensis]
MTKKGRARADAFSSLLGGLPVTPDAAQGIALDQIRVRPDQPRRYFDDGALDSLTESVRQQGILQPVLLRPVTGGYELIAGERRLRAARQAGLSEIPATVREVSDEDVPLLAALENLQRQDLNPLDEVEAILALTAQELQVPVPEVVPLLHAQRRAPDPDTVARLDAVFARLGRGSWASFAANRAGVLRFPPDLLTLMRSGQLEYTRAAALARIKDDALRREWTERALNEGLGVREIAAARRAAPAPDSRTQRVRRLIDDRRIAALGRREQGRVQKLLDELEALLEGAPGTD